MIEDEDTEHETRPGARPATARSVSLANFHLALAALDLRRTGPAPGTIPPA